MKKRVLSAFMALALCLTLLPVPVWAAETDADAQSGTDDTVYSVDPDAAVQSIGANANAVENAVAEVTASDGTVTQYASLNDAVSAAQGSTGATVKLLANVTTTSAIVVNSGTFTIDLNGQRWERSSGHTLWVKEGNVTVTSTQNTGTISNDVDNAIYVANNATVHVTSGVRLNQLCAMQNVSLTLDTGVIITRKIWTASKGANIAPFLTDKALQKCDADGTPTEGKYVSIYQNYDETDTGCVIVIEHENCTGTPSQDNPCEICGYDGTQTKPTEPTEPVDPNVAMIGDKKYESLQTAIGEANGADITLLKIFGENVVVSDKDSKASIILGIGDTVEGEGAYPSYWTAMQGGDLPRIPLTMNAGEITLKEGVLAQFGTGGGANVAIALKGGTLTVESTVTKIIGGSVDSTAQNTAQNAAIEATGGTLDLQGNTHLDGGLSISGDAQLAHKLKAGIFTNSGSTTASVSVDGGKYSTVFDLLETGYAFAKYDKSAKTTGDVIAKDATTKELKENVTVIKCEHKDASRSLFNEGKCIGCGFTCTHSKDEVSQFENGVCKVCGYVCPHTNVEEQTAVCTDCGATMVVKVEVGEGDSKTTTYYAARRNSYNDDETLWWLFNNALESGSTVTLLADGLYACAWVTGKTITLNLNGKNVIENNGFVAAEDEQTHVSGKLTVIGSGSSTTPADNIYSCTFRVWGGGTLIFADDFGGSYGTIYVHGGTLTSDSTDMTFDALEIQNSGAKISLKGGTFDKITGNNNKTLGDLLPPEEQGRKSGKAFKYTGEDGAFVPYDTQITSSGVENVTITDCPHDSIKSGKDTAAGITYGICGYCGMDNIAAVLTKPDGGIKTYTINDSHLDIFNTLSSNGGTLKLYSNLTFSDYLGTQGGTTKMVIDLNGHTISLPSEAAGLEVTLNGGKLTITDSSSGKSGSFSATLRVYYTASLTVDGVKMGTIGLQSKTASITLKEGTTFTGYEKLQGMPLADWIEDGYGISDVNLGFFKQENTGNYTVTKAPATITAGSKSGKIEHGEKVPARFLPTITSTGGTTPDKYFIQWWRRTENDVLSLGDGTLCNGKFEYGGTNARYENANVNDKLDVFCTITAQDSNYYTLWQAVVKGYTLTVTKGTAQVTIAPTAAEALVYTGEPQALLSNGGIADGDYRNTMQYSLDGTTWTDNTIPTGTDAGEYTVYYRAAGDENRDDSEPQSIKVTIAPMGISSTPTFSNLNALIKEYDGTTAMGGAFKITGFYQTADGTDTVTLTQGTDFTVDAKYAQADAGEKLEVTMNFTLKSGNYAFANGAKSATYTSNEGIINQSTAPTQGTLEISVANNHAQTYTVDLSGLLPALSGSCSYGTVTYGAPTVSLGSYYASGAVIDENGILTLPIQKVDSSDEKEIGTIKVRISSTNYSNFELEITVKATNKLVPQGTPTLSTTTLTYGDTLSKITLSGTMKDSDGKTVAGTFAWTDGTVKPSVGSYAANWKFTPNDSTTYAEVTGTADVAVNKATPSGAPKYTAITTSGKKLSDAALAANGSWPAGTVKWVDANGAELAADTEVTANTAYKWVFTPTDSTNYNTIEGSVTLWQRSSGGGGGSSSGTTTKTETTTNPDGSTTKTETKSDGTVIETTTNKDGSSTKTESKTETKSDGSTVETVTETRTETDGSKTTGKTETVTAKDGTKTETKTETSTAKDGTKTETKSETKTETDGTKTETKSETTTAKDGSKTETKSETKTDANGVTSGTETSTTTAANGSTGTTTTVIENGVSKTEAEAKISDKAVSDAKKSDEAVKIPTEVKAGGDSASAPTVKIDLPKNSGETKIEIPVKDVSAGTVAVIVHPDGTEELIKESLPTEGGVQLTVDGSVTVKIVDNAKDFKDTKNHWAADSIDFVSARGLVNGTGGDSFDPNAASTRAQLWTILARQIGADLTGGASWYEKAQEWAKANGISDGSNPDSSITRAQMVTMLWRAAGSPKAEGTNAFNDVSIGSYYADAIAWAAAHGITTGVGNGAFDPNGTCTRAQIAAFLHRSYLSE